MLLCLLPLAACAQQQEAVLYAGLIKTQGYVVGSALSASGLQRLDGDTTWTHLGWNTPRISGLSFDPTDPDVIYLASGNGILRTRDGGASWRVTTDWRVTEAQDVDVDPNAPQNIYAGTAYGVWHSDDGAETWHEVNNGIPAVRSTYTQTIEVDRTQTGRVVAGTAGGVYLTENAGASWQRVGADGIEVLDLQQSAKNPQVWIAATQGHGVWLSGDNAATWQQVQGAIARQDIHAVAIDPFDAERMVAVGWDTGVLLSTDGGQTWARRGDTLPTPRFYEAIFDANEPGRIWAATLERGIFHSDDDGQTWTYAGMNGTMVFDLLYIGENAP